MCCPCAATLFPAESSYSLDLHLGETVDDVLHYINVTGVAGDAKHVELNVLQYQPPSKVSNCHGEMFQRLSKAILESYQSFGKVLCSLRPSSSLWIGCPLEYMQNRNSH